MYNAELKLGLETDPELEERYRSTVNALVQAHNERPELVPPATALKSGKVVLPSEVKASIAAGESPALSSLSAPARQNYIAARNALGDGAWMRRDVERALSCQHGEASERIREWRAAGLVVEVNNPKWHYRFTHGR